MALKDEAAKLETLAKLAQSRAEIRRVLEPPPHVSHGARRVDQEHIEFDDMEDRKSVV